MFVKSTEAIVPLQSGGVNTIRAILALGFSIIFFAGVWKAFQKANEPGWAGIVPIYNVYVMIKIGENKWWWLILLVIPLINVIALLKINIDVAKAFGQGLGFGVGLAVLPYIFWPLLGFGGYQYRSQSAQPAV